ncbi:ABC transporter permease [Foetidibacter luteolus]|uniref:ABC transporter permease n=1 Tax=Foetidibacter luteolus TaxID=2608880 RepID=UPI00129B3187|nr:ABC transporter permease [Foetidibacter luteolus]
MFRTFLKTAWRSLVKDRLHALVNVLGLSIGMTVAILISLWMYDELSFDKQFANHDRIARVLQNLNNNGETQTWWSVPYPLADELRKNYGSDFKHIAMAVNWGDHTISIGEKKLKAKGGFFEKEMPEMFSLDMLQGKRNALGDPSSVLISASAAKAYFGSEDAINRIINVAKDQPLKVAGVYKDFAKNSTLAGLDFIASWDHWYHANNDLKDMEDPWRPNFISLFAQVSDNADFDKVSARIKDAKLKKLNAQLQKKKPALFLLPMSRWHLYSEYKDGVNTGGAIRYVKMFAVIGVFILLLACINFMNLSTARSEKRAREVGIRKTVGSLRWQLVAQFFSESLLTVVFAFILALLFSWFSLAAFNEIAGKTLTMPWGNTWFWLAALGFVLFTALVAGSYPAFYLSSFKPVKVLKGTFKAGRLAALPRKALVVVQFSVSVALMISTVIVYKQIQYAKDRPVGYSRANLVAIPLTNPSIHEHFNAVKEELLQTGNVASVAESESPTTGIWNSTSGFSWPGKDPNLSTDFGVVQASLDYGKTVGWQIKEGRDFSRDFATDSSAFILNESAVRFMGLKNPVGQTVTWWGKPSMIIGVINDMVMESPYDAPKPVFYNLSDGLQGNVAIIKIAPGVSAKSALSKIEPIFKKYNTEQPFEYKFVDDEYNQKFGNEQRIGTLSGIFTALAIFISCLGLFGLISFVAEQRRKEVGIRKVLGASVLNVCSLLSKEFVGLVSIAFLISVPIAWYFMNEWLLNYSYRTSISWWVFVLAGAGALLITLLTVSFQAVKTALMNPVKSLRTE